MSRRKGQPAYYVIFVLLVGALRASASILGGSMTDEQITVSFRSSLRFRRPEPREPAVLVRVHQRNFR